MVWASYGAALSEDSGKRIRAYFGEPFHQRCFPDCRLAPDSNAADRLGLTAGGGAIFVGRDGAITGRSATGLLLCDDLLKSREEADSSTIRDNLKKWFQQVAFTRLSANAGAILVGTPWHLDDLLGWLPREHSDQGWRILRLPALAEEDDPLGRTPGEPLWPEKHDAAQLDAIRRQMGSVAFVSLMQLRPAAAAGTVFKREWFKSLPQPWPSWQRLVQSWDTSFGKTGKRSGDYSACCTLGINNSGIAVLHVWRGKVDFPTLKRKVQDLAREWRVSTILIEAAGAGISLEQELRTGWEGLDVPQIIPREARGAKRLRAEAVSAMVEAGRVSLADGPWLPELLDELVGFPDGVVNDDQVDALCQGLAFLRGGYNSVPPPFILDGDRAESAWAMVRGMMSRPSGFRTYGGFAEQRPIVPQPTRGLIPPELGKKIIDGRPGYQLSDAEEWEILNSLTPESFE